MLAMPSSQDCKGTSPVKLGRSALGEGGIKSPTPFTFKDCRSR
nr:MAG TPA: hypothetical protein [Caudoviricetes sp.]